jgi:hypothetical protein
VDWDSSLASQLGCTSCLHFHTFSHSTVLPPHSLNLRNMVSPPKVVTRSLWEVINLPFCLLRQTWIWTWVLTSLASSAPLPSLVPALHCVPLCVQGTHPDLLERQIPPPDQAVHWHLVGSSLSGSGDVHQQQGKWKEITVSAVPDEPLRNVIGNSNRGTGLWGEEAKLQVEPQEQRGLNLYTQ